ncbi:terminase small subunit [Pseudomonas phage vB_PpuP-Kurepalu-1]
MAATSDRLGGLHELFTAYWEGRMRQASHPDPELCIPISAAELAVLRAFLKDNGVQADVTGDKELASLANDLKAATSGVVKPNEFDDIMADFNKQMGLH